MITCGNCKQSHSTVAEVKACYATRMDSPAFEQRVQAVEARQQAARVQADPAILGHDEFRDSTKYNFGRWDRAIGQREQFELSDSGIYQVGETVYKVYANQAQTRMLAKELKVLHTGATTWEYVGMAARFVRKNQRITQEQAEKFGKIYGVCAICGRTLTDEQSIAQGIGPVCIKKMGW